MVGHFVAVCKKSVKVNGGQSKVMVLNGEEGWIVKFVLMGFD